MFSVRSNDQVTVKYDKIVIGPIIDRDKRIICNYAIELNQLIELDNLMQDSENISFKDLKKILIEKNIRMTGMKPIDQVQMTEIDMLNDLEMIHLELARTREYAEKNNCQKTFNILHNEPYKIFRMKDQQSFEAYLDDINKIFDEYERRQTDKVGTLLNHTKFF